MTNKDTKMIHEGAVVKHMRLEYRTGEVRPLVVEIRGDRIKLKTTGKMN